jgi:hypothetical protein
MGDDARARATAYAGANFPSFEIVEKPPLKRATRQRREVAETVD